MFTPDGGAKNEQVKRSSRHESLSCRDVAAGPKNNNNSTAADRSNVAATGGGTGRKSASWNCSTRVDDLLAPGALLRKHPGWDITVRGREAGVRLHNRGGFFNGGSTARTITTISSSSSAPHATLEAGRLMCAGDGPSPILP